MENTASTSSTCERKRKMSSSNISHDPDLFAPKRYSPFNMFKNTPKERKEERRNILKITSKKLKAIEDPEKFLRRSVLVNNQYRRLRKEMIDEKKYGYSNVAPPPNPARETSVIVSEHQSTSTSQALSTDKTMECDSNMSVENKSVCDIQCDREIDVDSQNDTVCDKKPDHVNNCLPYFNGVPENDQEATLDPASDTFKNDKFGEPMNINVDSRDTDDNTYHQQSNHNLDMLVEYNSPMPSDRVPSKEAEMITNHSFSDLYKVTAHQVHDLDTCPRNSDNDMKTYPIDDKRFTTTNMEDLIVDNSSEKITDGGDKLTDRDRQILSGIDEIFNKLYNVLAEVDADLNTHRSIATEVQVC